MAKWKLCTEFTIDSAHSIDGYNGKCARLHGHTYRIRLEAESDRLHPSKYLATPDMVCDFRELKWAAADVEKRGLDHANLNDLLPGITSAERLAEFVHQETKKRIPESISLKVTVWETPNSWVEYTD